MIFIEKETSKRRVTIKDVETGQIFIFNNEHFLKMDEHEIVFDYDWLNMSDFDIVAVSLETGKIKVFPFSEPCSLLRKKITIEYDSYDKQEWI